jgi:hypothetical protein
MKHIKIMMDRKPDPHPEQDTAISITIRIPQTLSPERRKTIFDGFAMMLSGALDQREQKEFMRKFRDAAGKTA